MNDCDRPGFSDADLARVRELAERAGGSEALIRLDRQLRERNRLGRDDRDLTIAAPASPAPAPVAGELVQADRPCLDLGRRFARMMRRR